MCTFILSIASSNHTKSQQKNVHQVLQHNTHMHSSGVDSYLQDVLSPRELQQVLQHAQHRPNFVLAVLTRLVARLPEVSDGQKLRLDTTLTNFSRAVSSCERMIKAPMPRSYTR